MKLYCYPHAPYSRKVLLACEELGTAVEHETCAPFEPEAKKRLRTLHPLATVPLLVDGDTLLMESSLIVEHLDEQGRLVPLDRRSALEVRAWDRFADAHLMATAAYLAWAMRKPPPRNEEKIAAQQKTVHVALGLLDERLTGRAWIAGESLSLADLSCLAAVVALVGDRSIESLDAWPALRAWKARAEARASYQKVVEICRAVPLPPGFG